jgi:hypothetical protein
MNSQQSTRTAVHRLLALTAGIVVLVATGLMNAQVQTQTTTKQATTKHATVERGEVLLVDGNDLIVKMDDGQIRHFANVSESVRVDVDGQKLGIHDLKPGMKLQRTIITSTTDKTITTVKTVTGKVWHVAPPNTVILTMEDGTNQQFKIPNNQKFTIEGKQVDAWGLRKGMNVSATKVVEVPETVIAKERRLSGTMPPPPTPPPADAPILIAEETAPAPATVAEPAPTKLPKTSSLLPLIGLLGLLSLGTGFGSRLLRRS